MKWGQEKLSRGRASNNTYFFCGISKGFEKSFKKQETKNHPKQDREK
jgi:hypothetical protein